MRIDRRRAAAGELVACLALLAGCGVGRPINPSFPLTGGGAAAAARQMDATPVAPPRPVVVIGGIFDSPARVERLAARLRALTDDGAPIVAVSVRDAPSFEAALAALHAAVRALPPPPGDAPRAVDVVGVSMGGLVARYAAMEPAARARLRPPGAAAAVPRLAVHRLFTLATPHRGARAAWVPWPQPRVRDLRPGSAFLAALDADLAAQQARGLELQAYVRRGDLVVGTAASAPPGRRPFWLPTPPLELAHGQVDTDERILADIARHLRGEPGYATPPPAPFPVRQPLAREGNRHPR